MRWTEEARRTSMRAALRPRLAPANGRAPTCPTRRVAKTLRQRALHEPAAERTGQRWRGGASGSGAEQARLMAADVREDSQCRRERTHNTGGSTHPLGSGHSHLLEPGGTLQTATSTTSIAQSVCILHVACPTVHQSSPCMSRPCYRAHPCRCRPPRRQGTSSACDVAVGSRGSGGQGRSLWQD